MQVIGAHPPLAVSKANRGVCGGMDVLADIWWSKAETGFMRSLTWERIIFALVLREVLDQGMRKDDHETPFEGVLQVITVEHDMCLVGLKEFTESMISSPSLYSRE